MPNFSVKVYSHWMRQILLPALLLSTVIAEAGFLFMEKEASTPLIMDWKFGFFVLIPLGLALLLWFEIRWALVVCVFYATIGLAMDIATIVQAVGKDPEGVASILASGVSGLFYLGLIVFGGRSFLGVGAEPMPLESRPPNPPAPS